MNVTVIHLMPTLMERQLDEAAGWLLKTALEGRGQTILTGADTDCILGESKVEGVRLKDGRLLPAALVVMAVGVVPNTAPARRPEERRVGKEGVSPGSSRVSPSAGQKSYSPE